MPPYVIEITEGVELSHEELDRLVEQVDRAVCERRSIVVPHGWKVRELDASRTSAQMDRLLSLLSLSDQERAFVQGALTVPTENRSLFAVLADYLEEKQDPVAYRFRSQADGAQEVTSRVHIQRTLPERRAVLRLSADMLLDVLRLPDRTRILDARLEESGWGVQVLLRLTHPDFPEVVEGSCDPVVQVAYRRVGDQTVFDGWSVS